MNVLAQPLSQLNPLEINYTLDITEWREIVESARRLGFLATRLYYDFFDRIRILRQIFSGPGSK
jgi:hypothetical protein